MGLILLPFGQVHLPEWAKDKDCSNGACVSVVRSRNLENMGAANWYSISAVGNDAQCGGEGDDPTSHSAPSTD